MLGRSPIFFLLLLLLLGGAPAALAQTVSLAVPHLWEIPDGRWVPPWSGACEEASLIMVENFYLKNSQIAFTARQSKALMYPLFLIEDKLFGSNLDTNSTRTIKLINDFSSYDAAIKENPTVEEIKNELAAGRPVMSLHYGYDLNNPRHRFRRGGSSYHMMVVAGFDEAKQEFLVNDPELPDGLDFRYAYDTILGSLNDFNHATKRANGPPVVLFTRPKQIVKAAGGRRLYLVRDNIKYYIGHPRVFKNHRWSWGLVTEADKHWLDSLPSGAMIVE